MRSFGVCQDSILGPILVSLDTGAIVPLNKNSFNHLYCWSTSHFSLHYGLRGQNFCVKSIFLEEHKAVQSQLINAGYSELILLEIWQVIVQVCRIYVVS